MYTVYTVCVCWYVCACVWVRVCLALPLKNALTVQCILQNNVSFLFPLDVCICPSLAADAPKDVVATVNPTTVKEGEMVTLTCSAKGNPALTFRWFKNDTEQPGKEEAQWTIPRVTTEHNGRYNCEAHNKLRTIKSPSLDVHVTCGYFSC